ncbi:MAG TPA: hypothetical protein VF095_05405 [Bacillota bacterium]
MWHPYERFIQIELLSIGIATILCIFAVFQGYFFILALTMYMIVLSLICDTVISLYTYQTTHAGKQLLRALIIFLLTTYFLFKR